MAALDAIGDWPVPNAAAAVIGPAGVLATQLFQHRGWNYYAAFAVGIVVAALVGALADRLIIQRFFWAPRLVLTVATIGLAQILSGVELTLPSLFGGGGPLGGLSGGFKTPLALSFHLSPLLFSGAHVQVPNHTEQRDEETS